jgi:zinc protease
MTRDPLVIAREPLEGGLTFVRQDPPTGAPSVSLTYIGPGGTAYDPKDREGTSLLVSDLAVVAAGSRDRRELARHLDHLGATLHSQPSPESLEVTAWGPADRWEALLDVLADAVFRPRFDASDIAQARRQLKERQLRELTQPGSRADVELLHLLFPPGHPYYRSGVGTRRSLSGIDRATLVRFHREHFVLDGASIIVTGAMPTDRLRSAVARRFASESTRRAPPMPDRPAPRPARGAARTLVMPGRSQVEVRVGTATIGRRDARYPGQFLANEVLGGLGLLSRLFQRVREKAGLAYHASSDLDAMSWGGLWQAQAGTGPERTDRTTTLVVQEFRDILENPIPFAELDRIRKSAIGSIQLELETTAGVHDLAVDAAYFQLPETFYREWPAVLRRLTPRQVLDAVTGVVDPERLAIVSAGPARLG